MVTMTSTSATGGKQPPEFRGGLPLIGHMLSFARNPYLFAKKVADEVGEIAAFKLFNQKIVLLTGEKGSELFYRSTDEQLDQSAAYKLMTPIFGEGLVFDAPLKKKDEQLKALMPSLRMEAMRDHSAKIVQEVEQAIANWGESGQINLVDFTKQLTINTASHCLLGREFRYELSDEFARIYHDLEQGVTPIAYHFPNLPIPRFRRRDRARARLQELVGQIVQKRKSQATKPSDMFQTLIDMRYEDGQSLTDNEITGLLVGAIFAGHHTSSGTAAWVLLELLKHPHLMREVIAELDEKFGRDGAITFQSMREVPKLENVLKEVLRLHPPLIILMRQVSQDLHFGEYTIKAGDMVWASPPVTHRNASLFRNPEAFDPDRFSPERGEDKNLMAYQPFGGGKHKCSGNAFALFQIKVIFAMLLRKYEFELVDKPDNYVDDYHEMIVQPKSPCYVRYKKRVQPGATHSAVATDANALAREAAAAGCPFHASIVTGNEPKPATHAFTVSVDPQLCQGHAVCMAEAPEIFKVDDKGVLHVLQEHPDSVFMEKAQKAAKHCPNRAITITTHHGVPQNTA